MVKIFYCSLTRSSKPTVVETGSNSQRISCIDISASNAQLESGSWDDRARILSLGTSKLTGMAGHLYMRHSVVHSDILTSQTSRCFLSYDPFAMSQRIHIAAFICVYHLTRT
ncbi:hypothetical protein P692DRAFT_20197199 [Suillus brevipes Sb2]|nr:hypothetical protein P692DRAFT_20197199 [Suillus brevipes Sb2]